MIRLTGFAKSGERYRQPPPAPSSSSSSSSTLSPLAPPFTVVRSHPIVKNPNHILPPPPTSALPQYFVPKRNPVWSSSSSSSASRMTNCNSGFGAVDSTRYYPYYAPAHDSVDVFVEKMPDYNVCVGEWSGDIDLEEGMLARGSTSPWTNSLTNCENPLPLMKSGASENFSTYDDYFGSWHGALNESSSTFGYTGSEWLDDGKMEMYVEKSRAKVEATEVDTTLRLSEDSSYFYSPETSSIIKECETLNPNSYDRYISQLNSCSKNHVAHYSTKSQSGEEYAPSNTRKESLLSCRALKNGNSVVVSNQHKTNGNEASICDMEVKEGFEKMGIPDHALQKSSRVLASSSLAKDLTSGNGSTLEQPIDCLPDYKFGFKVPNLSCCIASNSEKDTFKPNDYMRTSLESPDHLNVAVDSPCWKGASMSRQHPFDETLQPQAFSVINGSNDLDQGQNTLSIQPDVEQDRIFACSKSGNNILSSILKDLSSDTKFQEFADIKSDPVTETEQLDICRDHAGVFIEQGGLSQSIDGHATQLIQPETINSEAGHSNNKTNNSDFDTCLISIPPNFSSHSKRMAYIDEVDLSSINNFFPVKQKSSVLFNAPNKYSSQGGLQFLVKAMLSLSEVMLCHYSNDYVSLGESDLSSVMQTIDNLNAAILQSKKDITGSCSRSLTVETQPEISNGDKSIKHNVKNAMCSELNNNKNGNMMKTFSNSFEESDEMAQAFAKILKSELPEPEEDHKSPLYKNLWVQTEASLCSLKHDVALMKYEIENIKHHFKEKSHASLDGPAELVQVMGTSCRPSLDNLNSFDSHLYKDHKAFNCSTSTYVENPGGSYTGNSINLKQDDETDASVFARLKILKGRDQVILSGADEPQDFNTVKCFMDREKIGEMKEPALNLSSVKMIEKGVLQSHNVSGFAGETLKNLTVEKHPDLKYRLESGLLLSSKQPAGVQESYNATSDGSAIQTNNPKSNGKWLLLSCNDSSSSEWEHVLKDEFVL